MSPKINVANASDRSWTRQSFVLRAGCPRPGSAHHRSTLNRGRSGAPEATRMLWFLIAPVVYIGVVLYLQAGDL